MKVASVNSKAVEKVAEGLVDESTGRSHAVNITFYNADGEEIEVKCFFCNSAYTFGIEELKEIERIGLGKE